MKYPGLGTSLGTTSIPYLSLGTLGTDFDTVPIFLGTMGTPLNTYPGIGYSHQRNTRV